MRGAVAARGATAAAAVALPAPVIAPRPRPRAVPAPAPHRPTAPRRRVAVAGSPFLTHLRGLPDLPLLDRLLRSRAWIVLLGIALGGIVAMQVSLLGMNAGISEAVVKTTALEQDKATLQQQISELSDGERIRAAASAEGLLMPSPGDVGFLTARGNADALRAAQAITAPSDLAKQVLAGTASTETAAGQTSVTAMTAPGVAAAAANDPAAPAPEATSDGVAAPTAVPTAAPTAVTTTPPPAATAVAPPPAATTAPPAATAVPVTTSGAAAAPTG